ncbi:MAG: hypothetical protein ABSH20_11015 [Tepidisphaeraceae bacterium]|jgi:hypothetical protein
MFTQRNVMLVAVALLTLTLGGTAGAEEKMEPLPLKPPKPGITGTPKEIKGITGEIESPAGKVRPPFLAPAGCVNLAFKRPVTSSDPEPIIGKLEQITDGDKDALGGSWVELALGRQWVQIDLGKPAEIHAILVWHRHDNFVVYKGVVVQVASDPDFINGVKTLFNNDQDNSIGLGIGDDKYYFEDYQGKLIEGKGVKARYVRLWSNGSTMGDANEYTEVEVWGK